MNKRWLIVPFCAALAAGALAGCAGSASSKSDASSTAAANTIKTGGSENLNTDNMEEITLVYAEVNPLDSIAGKMATDFKSKAEELSDGKITVDIRAGGVLGSEDEVLAGMLSGEGSADMARISAFALTSHGGAKSSLLSLPYTFVNREHFWNFANSELSVEFLKEPSENEMGIRGLWYGEEGFRHFFSSQPVDGIADLKGMKIRVADDPVMEGLVESLGASASYVAFTQLYEALEEGTVDGAEQPIANYRSNAFHEVAPYLILDGHTLGAIQVVMTDEAWNRLNEDQQACVIEAGQYASDNNRANSEAMEEEILNALKEEGVTVVEVEDIAPWQEATAQVIEANTEGYEELYRQILGMQ